MDIRISRDAEEGMGMILFIYLFWWITVDLIVIVCALCMD